MTVDLPTTEYHTVDRLPEIRGIILGVYSEVYADDIATDPFFSLERFEQRLDGHTSASGWGCVIARVGGEPAGFTYGFTARDGTTFTLCENMLRDGHRGPGIARVMHGELMSHRDEERAQLLVRRSRPPAARPVRGMRLPPRGREAPVPGPPAVRRDGPRPATG